jgi:hypothetical protein
LLPITLQVNVKLLILLPVNVTSQSRIVDVVAEEKRSQIGRNAVVEVPVLLTATEFDGRSQYNRVSYNTVMNNFKQD